MKERIIKKIATGMLVAIFIGGNFVPLQAQAQAQSASDLASQINALLATITSLQAQLALLQGGQTSGGTQFTQDLTIGSTGSQVTALQTWLINKGHVIPAGATGYFGGQTQAALASYQRAQGITPAIGYFGPVTRARINSTVVVTPTPTPTPNPNPAPSGHEGNLRNFETLGDIESEVNENDSDTQILGIGFEAEDSEMTIERVDVKFTKNSGDGSNRIDRYVDSVSLWLDGKQLGSLDASEASRDDSTYTFRFTSLKGMVDEDETGELYVAVDAVSNLDSQNDADTWDVIIPEDGIRARDGAGITETYANDDFEETVTFSEARQGDLDISEANDNPDESVNIVSETNDTTGVTLLSFELEANDQDIEVKDIPVGLNVSGNANDVGDIVKTLKLMRGSKVLKSKTVPANAGIYEEIVFTDVNLTIGSDDTETLKVVADVRKLSGDFHEGDILTASSTGDLSGWDVEDESGDDVTPTGRAEGNEISFYLNGIQATLVSVSEKKSFTADESGEADLGEFKIVFEVKALEDDIYLDRSVTRGLSGSAGDGFLWATTSDSTTGLNAPSAFVSAANTDSGDTSGRYRIREGQTRKFTLTVNLEADTTGVAGIMMTGINWTNDSNDSTPDNFYTVNLNNFKTDLLTLFEL